jgi:GT2 family glycosyltransferase
MSARVAVAVPTRNRPEYVGIHLTSLLAQTFRDWMLVLNDQSDEPVERQPHVADLLAALRREGHEVRLLHTRDGARRHQDAMEAVPPGIDTVVRIDDDMLLTPTFLERLLRASSFLPGLRVAAVGGCVPQPQVAEEDLDVQLQRPGWSPTVDAPTWRLQGHPYIQRELLEVESLGGGAIAYSRRAVEEVGGWVAGYSDYGFREETDVCARLRAAGYTLLVTTDARAYNLSPKSGGARQAVKTPQGVVWVSETAPVEADERLFRARLAELKARGLRDVPLRRYRLADLERGAVRARPMQSARGAVMSALLALRRRLPEPVRAPLRRLRDLFS